MTESRSTFPPKAIEIYLNSPKITGVYRDKLLAATTYDEQCEALHHVVESTQDNKDLIASFSDAERQEIVLGAIAAKHYLNHQ
ncbi:hypothetical protein [Arthrobacter sp. A2-55]|uniref:hypothetical protein n=1 Tax=Arthrobacter sp. A2-55 TaxID=2897337 RepID=UPI0021CDA1AD|nr:hypothetical protein [Arthrobacter sp. A2-55]MCU6480610.1 hypothetical protein [Arthrobacter sp. A2-55]